MQFKEISLVSSISGEIRQVSGLVISSNECNISIGVKTIEDAFHMSYCHRSCTYTKIEKLKNNYPENYNYLVVVYR